MTARKDPDALETREPIGRLLLPCGHPAKSAQPVSVTRTTAWYRCSAGCELQRVRRSTPT